jgi:hypothetical protein
MSAPEAPAAGQVEPQEIVAWRFEALLRAGYSADGAARLAVTREVDLHIALELLAHGCPESTAVRILV